MTRRSKQPLRTDFKPGPIAWARRRVLPLLAKGTALLGLLILAAWIAGRVLTDQHHWSQYLWWLPPIWAIGAAWVLLIVSALCTALARRLGGLLLRPLLLIAALGCSIYLVIGVWHTHRVLGGHGDKQPDTVRVLHWNQAAQKIDQAAWGDRIQDLGADIVLIANADWGESRQTLLEQFAYFAPTENRRWVNYSYRIHADPAHYRVEGAAMIASRYPMTRTGMVSFGSSERQPVLEHSASGSGWVMFAEFDLDPERADDEPLIVWLVDLPSDPGRWKRALMAEVRSAIDSWDGTGWAMGRHVWEQQTWENASFPQPDLVIGDFNTPRGSGSLETLAPGYTDAFEQAGFGRGRSWMPPSRSALMRRALTLADWHIDLALTAPGVEATRYELIGTESGNHRVQMVDISPRTSRTGSR
ncbi:MAG: endonuclease/exonuclease/phosphatase family protein [Phycisphaerales bacterium]